MNCLIRLSLSVLAGIYDDIGLDYYRLTESPMRFEAGTPAIAEPIGLGRAVDYLEEIGMENIEAHERWLVEKIYRGLTEIPHVEVYGPQEIEKRAGIISFNIGNLHPHDAALALDVSAKVMVRSGRQCAFLLMKELLNRREGVKRASLHLCNTKEEIEKLISATSEIAKSST